MKLLLLASTVAAAALMSTTANATKYVISEPLNNKFQIEFTTGAEAVDKGYYLVTSAKLVHWNTWDNVRFENIEFTGMQPGVAFDPATGLFINRAYGVPDSNSGSFSNVIGFRHYATFDIYRYDDTRVIVEFYHQKSSAVVQEAEVGEIALPSAGVPEPTSWAMMIAGFGMVGAAMRRRQKVALTFG